MIRPLALFALFTLFWALFSRLLLASPLHDWIVYEKSTKIPVLAVSHDTSGYDKLREVMKSYEGYLERFEATFRVKALSSKEFSAEFPDLEERSYGSHTAFYFFADDGMLLLIEIYSVHELPGYGIYLRYEEAKKEYEEYLAQKSTPRGELYWPRRAWLSGRYPLARTLLKRISPSRLSEKERNATYILLEMLYRREQESMGSSKD